MNCEQVKELLSAFLDNKLAQEERQNVAIHLQTCAECSTVLADFHHFDALLASLPRVNPSQSVYNRIFTSPEYLELTGTSNTAGYSQNPNKRSPNQADRPRLIALPGGRHSSSNISSETHPAISSVTIRKRRSSQTQQIMRLMIAASLLLTIGVVGYISWNILQRQERTQQTPGGIVPPAGPQQGPIPAGLRFVFLRDGALWSAPSDGGTGIIRLTPQNTTVAANWTVRPAQAGRPAGNMLAYIDLQQGLVHTIRSDDQNDSSIQQPLIKQGLSPTSIWDTTVGITILNGLTWSKDGSMLAFVAAPNGTPELYLYTPGTEDIQQVSLPQPGAVSHPVWSPDGIRITFELRHNDTVSILDYNTQNHGVLTIASAVNTHTNAADSILILDWSPSIDMPTITWSVGAAGHTHSIWSQRVGAENMSQPRLLAEGDYLEATYSRSGHAGNGGWLLVKALNGQPGDLASVDLGGTIQKLSSAKQVAFAQWSPDGTQVSYFDGISSGIGALHILRTQAGSDALVATGVASDPAPTWSPDSQRLVYSTSTHTLVVDVQTIRTSQPLKLQGPASAFSWSATLSSQLILSISDGQPGIYLVDIQHDTSVRLDTAELRGTIWWTQIP